MYKSRHTNLELYFELSTIRVLFEDVVFLDTCIALEVHVVK